jgi:hypothetical protein
MARIFGTGIDFGIDADVQSLVVRVVYGFVSQCRAADAASLSARISFQQALSTIISSSPTSADCWLLADPAAGLWLGPLGKGEE